MSVREAFGKEVEDLEAEMSNSPAHYRQLTQVVKHALLDCKEEVRKGAQRMLERTSIVYDAKFGTSRIRPKKAPLFWSHRHREYILQTITTVDEIYLVLTDDEGRTRMAYLCGLEQATAEGLSVHPFKIDHFQVPLSQHP